ncbi:hypothetical protein Bca4012_004143 [Brassica carinata]
MADEIDQRCLLSHPALTHHNLSMDCNFVIPLGCSTCGGKYTMREQDNVLIYCTTCGVEFHNGCDERPRRITHPYHLQHPLTLFYRDPETGTISNIIPDANPCKPHINDQEPDTSDQGKYKFVDIVPTKSDIIFDKCTWCGKDFEGVWFYRYLICSFCLDLPCAKSLPPLTITNPKGHHHSLIFLPRPLLHGSSKLYRLTTSHQDHASPPPSQLYSIPFASEFLMPDTEKLCEACVYPIVVSDQFYDCEECDYSLHENISPIKVMVTISFSYQPSVATKIVNVARTHVQGLMGNVRNVNSLCVMHVLQFHMNYTTSTTSIHSPFATAKKAALVVIYIGARLPHYRKSAEVIRNSSNSRQLCYTCGNLCTASIYYEGYDRFYKGLLFTYKNRDVSRVPICSLHCLTVKKW